MSLQGPSLSRSRWCSGEAKPGRVHRRQLQAVHGERLARGAEIDEHRSAVVAHVDVARLDVQVQQLVGMHFAQAVQQLREGVAHPVLLDGAGLLVDVLLQRAAALVAHHQVHRVVGAEKIYARAPRSDATAWRARGLPRRSTSGRSGRWRDFPPAPPAHGLSAVRSASVAGRYSLIATGISFSSCAR